LWDLADSELGAEDELAGLPSVGADKARALVAAAWARAPKASPPVAAAR
jgi:hypothetical protein